MGTVLVNYVENLCLCVCMCVVICAYLMIESRRNVIFVPKLHKRTSNILLYASADIFANHNCVTKQKLKKNNIICVVV